MNYMEQIDAWLEEIGVTEETPQKVIKEKILESYKNGRRDVKRVIMGVLNGSRKKDDKKAE